jgi:hypothetical protein
LEALLPKYIHIVSFLTRKKLVALQSGGSYIVFDADYDRILKSYYEFLVNLLEAHFHSIKSPCLILLGVSGFSYLTFFFPVFRISLQIEHTLVKLGARDSVGAFPGHIEILGSTDKYLIRLVDFAKLTAADIVFENIFMHYLFIWYLIGTFHWYLV